MNLPPLLPGDHLLYGPSNLIGRLICLKTWSPCCHIEIYIGAGKSVASRDGIGVGKYNLRLNQLVAVLRPKPPADMMATAMTWFDQTANGQKYDFLGLLCFFLAAKRGSPDRMFCSEFATQWDWRAGIESISRKWSADKVAPGDFLMSPAFDRIL